MNIAPISSSIAGLSSFGSQPLAGSGAAGGFGGSGGASAVGGEAAGLSLGGGCEPGGNLPFPTQDVVNLLLLSAVLDSLGGGRDEDDRSDLLHSALQFSLLQPLTEALSGLFSAGQGAGTYNAQGLVQGAAGTGGMLNMVA